MNLSFLLYLIVVTEFAQFVSSQLLVEPKDTIIEYNETVEFKCSCKDPDDPENAPDLLFFINGVKIDIGGGVMPYPNAKVVPQPYKKGDGRTSRHLKIERATVENSAVINCTCAYPPSLDIPSDSRNASLYVRSPVISLSLWFDGSYDIPTKLIPKHDGSVQAMLIVDLKQFGDEREAIFGHVNCTVDTSLANGQPELKSTETGQNFRLPSVMESIDSKQFELSREVLDNNYGYYSCIVYDKNNNKHHSETIAIGRAPTPGEQTKTALIIAESRKGVLSFTEMSQYDWGHPKATITWYHRRNNHNVRVEENERISFSGNLTALQITDAIKSDSGMYYCWIQNDFGEEVLTFTVNVIDKYLAVWPFFGLVLEVVFFAVAIIIYEKHSNKPSSRR